MTNAYLLPDVEEDGEQASFIRFRAEMLFEHELEAWCTDTGKWPTVRNYKAEGLTPRRQGIIVGS